MAKEVINMTLEEKVKQLELENAKLKRTNIKLVNDFNHLHGIATELNKQVKEYRLLVGTFVESANCQLDRTETYVLGSVKKIKESL